MGSEAEEVCSEAPKIYLEWEEKASDLILNMKFNLFDGNVRREWGCEAVGRRGDLYLEGQ